MKKLLSILCLSATISYGQNTVMLTKEAYQQLKQSGLIDPQVQYSFSDFNLPIDIKYSGNSEKNSVCDCFVPLDSTFTLAMGPNDDESSGLINLPFNFDFYGNQFNSLYINNNGNISFVSPYMTFTPNSFPDSTYNMIAPFWADVDTRGGLDSLGNYIGNGGAVWYKVTPTALIVNWNQVGYFNMHTDLVSTFQLIISNGNDSLVSAGGNVSFCYDDMQWTTGDASMGSGGFGGYPATVGVNVGNGADFFQVGQFVQTGTSFDGPTNNVDGVDFLDGQEIYFNIAGATSTNTPPLLISSAICDTISVLTGDTLKSMNSADFIIGIMTPEDGQSIQLDVVSDAPQNALNYVMTQVSNQYYDISFTFNGTGVSPGIYHATITATDNGTPVGVTTKQFIFEVKYDSSADIIELGTSSFSVYPNPTNDIITVIFNSASSQNEVQVFDLYGKLLLSQNVASSDQLDLRSLNEGIYLINLLENSELKGTHRVLKN
jgi:hypothetical protein